MRTKLSVAAALAALAITAQAQVYSVNIVGYVNQTLPANGSVFLHNPLDDGTNTVASVLSSVPNGTTLFVWNGSGYDFGSKSGKGVWSFPTKPLPTGTAWFIKSPSAFTNTFVGETLVGPGESVTNSLPALNVATGSLLPYGGDLNNSTSTNLNLGNTLPAGSSVFKWTGTTFDFASKSGKGTWSKNLAFGVGEGIFMKAATATNWVQQLPSN